MNQTRATDTGDPPDHPWTRRKAEAILCAAWAAPVLLTLVSAMGTAIALRLVHEHWAIADNAILEYAIAGLAAVVVHGIATLAIWGKHGTRTPDDLDIR